MSIDSSDSPSPRLAIVLSHPVQYYSPWFRWLATEECFHLRVFYLWKAGIEETRDPQFRTRFSWDIDLLSGYESEFIPNAATHPSSARFNGLRNPTLIPRLRQWEPDAVLVFGYAYHTHLKLILQAPWPLIFRGDSHLLDSATPPLVKRLLLGLIYKRFMAITYVGQANREYFAKLGVPDRKLFFAPHCVDGARFQVSPAYLDQARKRRESLGATRLKIFLFAGKFVEQKQPLALLRAWILLALPGSLLLLAGDGPLRQHIQQEIEAHPDCGAHLLPFSNQSEMPGLYLTADFFVLPSKGQYETWGLAVNEAMQLGIPCIVSDRVGCQRDLVTEGKTGWVFAANDLEALKQTLRAAWSQSPKSRSLMQKNIAERIAGYSYHQAAIGLKQAFESLPTPSQS